MSKKQIYKPGKVKGFPEWLPEERLIEQEWLDHIRSTFESYGFASIETPAVEELNVLLAKGETDKEIYTLTRLQQTDEENAESRLGLHFDQTVPFARYTAQHFNDLTFPFKRYQMQKVWRGERPQLGRMREFLQCDIDVINVDHLPLQFDAEIPAIIYEVLTGLDIGRVQIKISNRKIVMGYLQALGIDNVIEVTRIIDKLDKIGEEEVDKLLSEETELSDRDIKSLFSLINIQGNNIVEQINEFVLGEHEGVKVMKEGAKELEEVMLWLREVAKLSEEEAKVDLSIVRGLDYYTGTVYETNLLDIPEFTSSVCSGGRYDDLAGSYINKKLPGVGISIGFTRLFDVLRHNGYIKTSAKCPTDILVVLPSEEEHWLNAGNAARKLREKGWNVETYHAPQKIGKQIAYAEKKGIRYVYFPDLNEVKDLTSGEQTKIEMETWKK